MSQVVTNVDADDVGDEEDTLEEPFDLERFKCVGGQGVDSPSSSELIVSSSSEDESESKLN